MKHDAKGSPVSHGARARAFHPSFRWILTMALLAVTVWLIYRQDPEFLSQVTLDWKCLVPAAWLLGLYIVLLSERFRFLTQLYLGRRDLSARMFLHSLVVSRVLNGILPQAGNVYRGSRLLDRVGLPWSGYLAVVIAGMIVDLIVIAVVFGVVLIDSHLYRISLPHFNPTSHLGILTLSILATVISVVFMVRLDRKCRTARYPAREGMGQQSLATIWRGIFSPENFPALFFQSLIAVTLLGMVLWLILLGTGFDPGLLEATTLMVAARAAQYIVITPGNLGVRELVYAAVGSQLPIGIGAAVTSSILLRIMNWMVLGLLLLVSEAVAGWRKKRH